MRHVLILLTLVSCCQARCDLCEDAWLVVVANGGRSGSTTIVDMLNQLPGIYIAGERADPASHQDIVDVMSKYFAVATSHRESRSGPFQTYAPIDSEQVICNVQRDIKTSLGPIPPITRLLGFKTIKAAAKSNTLEWLRSVFPCARFVYNYRRDVHGQFASEPFFKRQGVTEKDLQQRNEVLSHNPSLSNTFDLALEDFSLDRFNALRIFAGDKRCTSINE